MATKPKKSYVGLLFTGLFLVVILVLVLISASLVPGFAYKANMPSAAFATLTALIAVTLFVERGMTVVNALLYGQEQRTIEVDMAQGTGSLDDLARLYGAKERVRLLGSFIAALFVSAAGVRTLEGLLDTAAIGHPQNNLLIPVDVVLTAALIAGGSNGLAYLLQMAKERLSPPPSQSPTAPPPQARNVAPSPAPQGGGSAQPPAVDPVMRARLITSG